MSAVAGIRAEIADKRAERAEAAAELDKSHKVFMAAKVVYERDQMRVLNLSERIEDLAKALRILGSTEDER